MPNQDITDPNTRYYGIFYEISSMTDANNFCSKYNHANNYADMRLGDRIRINDGTKNIIWIVAGFDCEYNHTASDGTIKDNGYGIALVPEKYYYKSEMMHNNDTDTSITYSTCDMHTSTLVTVANNLKTVLGTHLINRNVLLCNKHQINANGFSTPTSYIWKKAYCTLLTQMQLGYTIGENKYSIGEANYELPLFKYMNFQTSSTFWLRYINIYTNSGHSELRSYGMLHNMYSTISNTVCSTYNVRPMIYIR